MKSIKPGRGPSAMSAFGGIIAALFGVFWTVTASRMGAPFPFPLFGILFIVMALAGIFYNYKNATGRNRMSLFDITNDNEEQDPFHEYILNKDKKENPGIHHDQNHDYNNGFEHNHAGIDYESEDAGIDTETANYCPYCGKRIKKDYMYCPKCGRDISK